MKISPLLQMMNQNASPVRTSSNSGVLGFSHFLVVDQSVDKQPIIHKKEASFEMFPFQQITDELSFFLAELSIEIAGIKSSFVQEEQSVDTQSPTITLLENEISSILSESYSIEEVIDHVKSSPTAVGVLSLAKIFEYIASDNKADFTPYLTKLNKVLDIEYPSYSNDKSIEFSSMIQAIDQMTPNDKALLEGQILLGKWLTSNDATRLLNIDKLLIINNKMKTEARIMPIQEAQAKSEILNELLAESSNKELENGLQVIMGKADLTTLQSIFHKTVETLFGKEIMNHHLNDFDDHEHFMSADSRDFSGEISIDMLQGEKNKLIISSSIKEDLVKGSQHVSRVESLKKSMFELTDYSDSLKEIETVLNLLQSGLNQLTETGIDFSVIAKEITSILNQYKNSNNENFKDLSEPNEEIKQVEKNLMIDFIGSSTLIKQDRGVVGTYLNSLLNQNQPDLVASELNIEFIELQQLIKSSLLSPINKVQDQPVAMPMINNLIEIATTAEQVANELSIDVNDVLFEIEKLIQANKSLTGKGTQELQLNKGITQYHELKEMTNPIVPLIVGVQALVEGINLLSSKLSIDVSKLISKVESSLQAELLDFKQLSKKGILFENISILYERLLAKLSKQDGKVISKIGDISSGNNKTITIRNNIQSGEHVSIGNTLVSYRQQLLDLTLSQHQETIKQAEVRGETIQGDKLFSKLSGIPVEQAKNEIPTQQEFTNLLTKQQMKDIAFSQLPNQKDTNQVEVKEETFIIQLDRMMSKQSVIPWGNQKTESTTRQEFANQLLNAFKTSKFAQAPNGANQLVIKLNPEHLGSLTVRLIQKNGEMVARIITSTESAKELLDHSVHQLKQALPSIQIEVDRFEVNTEQLAKTFRENSEQKEKQEKENHESRSEEEQENEHSFIESLKNALNTTA